MPFELGDGVSADHPPVGDDGDPAYAEALLQSFHDGEERLYVGGVARPHLGAERGALMVEDHVNDHLLQIGAAVLLVIIFPKAPLSPSK